MFSPIYAGPHQNAFDPRIHDDWTPIKTDTVSRRELAAMFADPRIKICGVESLARPEGITSVVFWQERKLPNGNHHDDEEEMIP